MSLFDDWEDKANIQSNYNNISGNGGKDSYGMNNNFGRRNVSSPIKRNSNTTDAEELYATTPGNPFSSPSIRSDSPAPSATPMSPRTFSTENFEDDMGYNLLDGGIEEEIVPEFKLVATNWQVGLPIGKIKLFAVARDQAAICIITAGTEQLWIWNRKKVQVNVATLDGKSNPLRRIFVCPSGQHCLINLENGDNYYINMQGDPSVARGPMPVLKNVRIEAVGWEKFRDDPTCSSTSTGDILLGSDTGAIFLACFEGPKWKEKYVRKVYQLDAPIPINGIEVVSLPEKNHWFVLVATSKPTRLYEFHGGGGLDAMFKSFDAPEQRSFRELPGDTPNSLMYCFTPSLNFRPGAFLVLSEAGLYIGTLTYDSSSLEKIADKHDMLYFPTKSRTTGETLPNPPVSCIETEFHYFLLYPSWFIVLNKFDETIVHEQKLNVQATGNGLSLHCDIATKTYWVHFVGQIMKMEVKNEDGSAWKLYLDQAKETGDIEKFKLALDCCKTDFQRDKVLTTQAEHYFTIGEFELSAIHFAQTRRSFEEISLMFIAEDKHDALRSYLVIKLQHLDTTQKTQRTIVAVWLVELFLSKLTNLSNINRSSKPNDSEVHSIQREFNKFLREYSDTLDPAKDTVYKLIASHGRDDDYLSYSLINGDYEKVVVRFMQRGRYDKAIETLAKESLHFQNNGETPPVSFCDLFYRYSPDLMEHCPVATVDAWLESSYLEPGNLIPALIRYGQHKKPGDEDQALRYLEHCVKIWDNREEAIHNLLVSVYASNTEDDTSLRDFLSSPDGCFDLQYCLRICLHYKQTRTCVDIYAAMGLFDEAVVMAMKIDQNLAKDNADLVKDPALRRKLWLLIAKHVISDESLGNTPIQRAIALLKETDSIMIEDVLPFLPNIAQIGELKEEICHALEKYGSTIEQLKNEMADLSATAETIRSEINQQDEAMCFVVEGQPCDLCGLSLLPDPSYVFPCAHSFHSVCLLNELARNLPASPSMEKLFSYIDIQKSTDPHAIRNLTLDAKTRQKLQELDAFLTDECPFCGELMIQSVADPFIAKSEMDQVREWEI